MTLGETIRDLRKQNNMSQEQLAEKLDVSRQSISLWEKDSTQPTIDNIITLSDIFGVTVDELLKSNEPLEKEEPSKANEEPAASDNSGNKKRFIIAALDVVVLAVGIYITWFFRNGSSDFLNVLDLHFNGSAVSFIESLPVVFGVLSALWLLASIFAFVKMKPFKIIKTVITMLAITLFIAGNVAGGLIDNAREKEAQDAIPQGVSYLDLKAFESIDASAEYEEQYVEGQTDSEIPVSYSVMQSYMENTAYTKCVEFTNSDYKNSELSRYFLELEIKYSDRKFVYFSDEECKELGITKGEYNANEEGKWLLLMIIKGNRVYYCEYDNLGTINDTVKEQIKAFK